jgi:hypothetical protein
MFKRLISIGQISPSQKKNPLLTTLPYWYKLDHKYEYHIGVVKYNIDNYNEFKP